MLKMRKSDFFFNLRYELEVDQNVDTSVSTRETSP